MYTDSYSNRMEIKLMDFTVEKAPDRRPTPPEVLEAAEELTATEKLLRRATTRDERRMVKLMEGLVDDAWQFCSTRALRGEMRRRWSAGGLSERRYFAAFHALAAERGAV